MPLEVSKQNFGGNFPATYRFARSWQQMLDEAHESLEKASRRMKKYADKDRRPLEFYIGDKVFLKLTPHIWKKISNKTMQRGLIPKYDEPFKVMQTGIGSLQIEVTKQPKGKPHNPCELLKALS